MTLALNEGPRRRQGILLALAAFLSVIIGVGAALAIKAMPADATGADQTFINISSAACVDGHLEIHLLAPQVDEAASGTVLYYTLDGSTWLTAAETVDANGHLDWHLVLTGSSFDASSFDAWAGESPRYEFDGHGRDLLKAALAECGESTGTITIIKHVDNSQNAAATGSAQDWQISVNSGSTNVAGSPQAGSESGTGYTLSPGTYTISESGGPAGYTQSWSSSCPGGTVVVTASSTVTCTLTNTANAAANVTVTVTVHKHVDGAPATLGSFNFTTTTVASNIAGCDDADGCTNPFTLSPATYGGSYMATTSAMAPGSKYGVSEVNVDSTCDSGDTHRLLGYKWGATLAGALALPSWSTDAPDLTVSSDMHIVVANVSCASGSVAGTGQITVQKVWNGTGDVHVGPAAVFTSTGPGVTGFSLTSGSTADSAKTFTGLGAGSFTFTEAAQAGWHVSSISCSADAGSVLGSTFVSTSTAASVGLVAGAHVTCVFTNEQDVTANRTIAIMKLAAPTGVTAAAGPFTGTIGSFGTFSVSIGGAASTPVSVPVNVSASITENPNALGYTTVGFAPAVNGVCPPAVADYQANPSSYQVSPGTNDVTICVMNTKGLNAVGELTPPAVFVPLTLNPLPTTVPSGPIAGPVNAPVLGVTTPAPITIAPAAPVEAVAGVRISSTGEVPLAPASGNGPVSPGTVNLWVLTGMVATCLGLAMHGFAMTRRR